MENDQTPLAVISEKEQTMQVDAAKVTDSFLAFLILSLGTSDSYFEIRYKIRGSEYTMYPEKLVSDEPDIDRTQIHDAIQNLNKADEIVVEKMHSVPQKMIPGAEYYT